jgi:hypothetical protein
VWATVQLALVMFKVPFAVVKDIALLPFRFAAKVLRPILKYTLPIILPAFAGTVFLSLGLLPPALAPLAFSIASVAAITVLYIAKSFKQILETELRPHMEQFSYKSLVIFSAIVIGGLLAWAGVPLSTLSLTFFTAAPYYLLPAFPLAMKISIDLIAQLPTPSADWLFTFVACGVAMDVFKGCDPAQFQIVSAQIQTGATALLARGRDFYADKFTKENFEGAKNWVVSKVEAMSPYVKEFVKPEVEMVTKAITNILPESIPTLENIKDSAMTIGQYVIKAAMPLGVIVTATKLVNNCTKSTPEQVVPTPTSDQRHTSPINQQQSFASRVQDSRNTQSQAGI